MRIGHVDQSVSHERRGYGYIAFRFQTPEFLARFEVVARDVRVAVGHNLYPSAGLENTGCGPTAHRHFGSRYAPEFASIRCTERREKAVFFAVRLNDDCIFEQHGRTREAPRESPDIRWRHVKSAQILLPLELAGERVAVKAFGAEKRDYPFAVGGDSCVRVRGF